MDTVVSSQDSPGAGYTKVKEHHGIAIWLKNDTGEFAAKVKPERMGTHGPRKWSHRRSLRDLEREIDKVVVQKPVKAFGYHYGSIVAYTIVRSEKSQFIDENGHRLSRLRHYDESAIEKIRDLSKRRSDLDREIQDTLDACPYLTPDDLLAPPEAPEATPTEEASV
jgi:hypothetical protein